MSEANFSPSDLDEDLWGSAPTEDDAKRAESGVAERAENWKVNPPTQPDPQQLHPEHPCFQSPTN